MKFTYLKQPPKRYTFEQPKLKRWIEKRCKGRVLNLFAGKVKLEVNEVRVDINEDMPADYHMDAYEFVKTYKGEKFDTVILDPPYSLRKSMEKYHGKVFGKFQKLKKILPRIMNDKCIVISLGYSSSSMSKGFIKKEICLVCHGGAHHDTVILVEEKLGNIENYIS